MGIAEVKRYLPDPVHRIRLRDLVIGEVNRAVAVPRGDGQPTTESVAAQMHKYEAGSSVMVSLMATMGMFSDTPEHDTLVAEAFRRLAAVRREHSGFTAWIDLQLYPALLALYSVGLGAIAARRLEPLAACLRVDVSDLDRVSSAADAVCSWRVLDGSVCNGLVAKDEKRKTPISDYLHDLLKEPVRHLLALGDEYSDAFDDLEYILGVACTAVVGRGPVGRFVWRQHIARLSDPGPVPLGYISSSLALACLAGTKLNLTKPRLPTRSR